MTNTAQYLLFLASLGFVVVQGPLYALTNATPVSRNFFCDHLTKTLKYAGLDPDKYKGHSFRIGAATAAADSSFSETQIQTMGRWNHPPSNVMFAFPFSKCPSGKRPQLTHGWCSMTATHQKGSHLHLFDLVLFFPLMGISVSFPLYYVPPLLMLQHDWHSL